MAHQQGPIDHLFATAPRYILQLSYNNMRMAQGMSSLWRNIQRGVAWQSAMEDEHGHVKVWLHGHHSLLLTPEGGFFVVVLRPPPEDGGRDVELLFAFRDLYLCGFLHDDGFWYVFSDAKLGPGININNHPWIRSLGYPGGYAGNVFQDIRIAVGDLYQAYLRLVDAGHPGVYRALYRIMVIVSEALRSVEWLKEVLVMYMEGRVDAVVDKPGILCFSSIFRCWSDRSIAVRTGEAKFKVPNKFGFNSYDDLLRNSGIVLVRPPVPVT